MAIKLGDKVKDLISGFEGIAVARTEWLYGCARITVEPDTLDDKGRVQLSTTFDEQRVALVEAREPVVSPEAKATTGGPYPDPVR